MIRYSEHQVGQGPAFRGERELGGRAEPVLDPVRKLGSLIRRDFSLIDRFVSHSTAACCAVHLFHALRVGGADRRAIAGKPRDDGDRGESRISSVSGSSEQLRI